MKHISLGRLDVSRIGLGTMALADDDWRKTNPRFTDGNFEKNLRIVDEVRAVASEIDATPEPGTAAVDR